MAREEQPRPGRVCAAVMLGLRSPSVSGRSSATRRSADRSLEGRLVGATGIEPVTSSVSGMIRPDQALLVVPRRLASSRKVPGRRHIWSLNGLPPPSVISRPFSASDGHLTDTRASDRGAGAGSKSERDSRRTRPGSAGAIGDGGLGSGVPVVADGDPGDRVFDALELPRAVQVNAATPSRLASGRRLL
jgi:hypothetical protein